MNPPRRDDTEPLPDDADGVIADPRGVDVLEREVDTLHRHALAVVGQLHGASPAGLHRLVQFLARVDLTDANADGALDAVHEEIVRFAGPECPAAGAVRALREAWFDLEVARAVSQDAPPDRI
jgi:hypothetical protein